jgi:flagellar hook protein FlgE
MGLSTAMTTALTGLQAAETTIDVAGNNLANSQTVGFKASDVVFATQFLRTLSAGSAPSGNTGGTNPRQLGLGVQVAEITPDFSQGTIEASAIASHLAIQGDGFFIVEGQQSEPQYTRNGVFSTNSQNELVSPTGHRLLGYGVDEFYNLETAQLVPLVVPLGAAVAAQATENVYLNGNLTPTGDVADTAAVIQSDVLEDSPGGSPITSATLLTDVVRHDGTDYQSLFEVGELTYTGRKGDTRLPERSFQITAETTVGEFLQFLGAASGIQTSAPGDPNPIPGSVNHIPGETGTLDPGGVITADGRLRIVSNNGTGNAMAIPAGSFHLVRADGSTTTPDLGFGSIQAAVGQSAASNFIVYDSLGVPLDVRLTSVLQARDGDATTYRWFADSGGNDPAGPDQAIAVGTGLVSFDGEGNLIQADPAVVQIQRHDFPSNQPLVFNLDFSEMSGFATDNSTIAASRQDGSPVGTLTRFSVGEGGEIMGIFSNGVTRTLGQIRLARFANPNGLEQLGQNLFGVGFNSGLPVEGNPGELGIGTILGGAVELSNTDTGANLIDLLLASTQYRANSRVISTAQQLLDELMNMRR